MNRFARSACLALFAAVGLLVSFGPLPTHAAPPRQSAGITYQLVDTWQKEPWRLTAGRYGETIDISSAPDGTTFVLDERHSAIHVLTADHRPVRVFPVGDGGIWQPKRLDAGWDGTVYLLSEGTTRGSDYLTRIQQLQATGAATQADGTPLLDVQLSALTPSAYKDLGIHPDGRIFLARAGPTNPYVAFPGPTATPMPSGSPPLNAIDVLAPDGRFQTRFGMEHLCMPNRLDVDKDGSTYVTNLCPSPFGGGGPGPQPTPRPSRPGPLAAPAQEAAAEGVLVFSPAFTLTRKVRFTNADDIAVGPAGAFVSRGTEIFALGVREPIYVSPAGRMYTAFFGEVVFNLDVPAAGGMLASMNHCFFQGVLLLAQPEDRPAAAQLFGALDQPELEGPAYPLRLDAEDDVGVLQGRFTISTRQPVPQYLVMPYYGENQVVQMWRPDGTLPKQIGACAQTNSNTIRDMAMDGSDVYTIDQDLLQRRADDQLPAWSFWPGALDDVDVVSRLAAVSARAGRVAVLDAGANRVIVVDKDMKELARWPVGGGGVPTDIALADDRVYLSDNGRSRVMVRGLDGRVLAEWPLHEGASGIAVGPAGDVFTVSRGSWGYRYTPDGQLVASWPMPEQQLEALDIGAGSDGRLYVPFLDRVPIGKGEVLRGADWVELRAAGVWVFAETEAPPTTPPPAIACAATPDKTAAPARIPLGATVDVQLTVQGRCPGRAEPAQVAVVFDTSRSMGFDDVVVGAKDGALDLLGALDPVNTEAALITFDDTSALKLPLTKDLAALRGQIAGLEAWGDTKMSTGLTAARLELTGARRNPAARQVAVVVTDGLPKDDPQPEAAALRAAGIDLYVLVYNTWEFQPVDFEFLVAMAGGDPSRVLVRPLPRDLMAAVRDLTGYRDTAGLFDTITITDEIPANMRYVANSAQPGATLTGNTLTWTFTGVMAVDTLSMTYTLEPLEVGTWPTNVVASAAYKDALGFDGGLLFPVPQVTVYELDRRASIYLPILMKGSCPKRERPLDIVLALDTSSSMTEAAPGGGTKLDAAVVAAGSFLDLLSLGRDRAGLVSFDREAVRRAGLTGDRAVLNQALSGLSSAQGTRIDLGLAEAGATLSAGRRPDARAVVVLLTDGIQSQGSQQDVLDQATSVKGRGMLLYTIGLGADVQPDLLRQVASSPDRYFPSPSPADLAEIYRQISERLACEVTGVVLRQRPPSAMNGTLKTTQQPDKTAQTTNAASGSQVRWPSSSGITVHRIR
jgi:Mg-chelatase subunit ChlD